MAATGDRTTHPTVGAADRDADVPSILGPGLLIGIGLGGFVDGIVLHQVLQWHHMLTNTPDDNIGLDEYPTTTVEGLETNTVIDGYFHVFTWFAVVIGLAMLWRIVASRGGPWSRLSLLGAVLAGWGTFNLFEGIVNHHILQIHHVRMEQDVDDVLVWDLGFLALGALLLIAGMAMYRREQNQPVRIPGGGAASQ